MLLGFRAVFIFFVLLISTLHANNSPLDPDLTVMVPMRDGTTLPTDLYFPEHKEGSYPCILLRCPAGRKALPWKKYAKLAEEGFLVAIQDTRGALDKEGKSIPYWADGWGREQDGYDAVEWLGHSPYTNGKIGTLGFSAVGITQQMLAPTAPPSLKCQYIGFVPGSIYHYATFFGGQLLKDQIEGWLGYYARDPIIYSYLRGQPHYNDFWSRFDTIRMSRFINVPAMHYGGWFDVFLQGTIDSFTARQELGGEGARGTQKLIIGPWVHEWPRTQILGDFAVPANALKMLASYTPKQWFNHYLKGIDNHVEELAPITYYVMGPFDGSPSSGNIWRTAQQWPVPAVEIPFYLSAEHGLIDKGAFNSSGAYSFDYDPEHPISTLGGRNLFLPAGPKDQTPIEKRNDVVIFTSTPFEEDWEITGRILGRLFFSSDLADTDVVLRFCDVYPDGRSILIADSIFRTGMLHHGLNCVEHVPGKPIEVELDLWSTSIVIAKGHRIRVSVSSSNFPRYEKNANCGILDIHYEKPIVAHNKIHFGGDTLSKIILPVVRKGNLWLIHNSD